MRIRFWGTRGSIATPGPGTNHFGGNTSCVEVVTNDSTRLVLDCGTGAHRLGAALMAEGKKDFHTNILLGHTHWDHIQGFPFFTPAFVKGNSAAIYAPEGSGGSLHNVLAGQMEFTYFPIESILHDGDRRHAEFMADADFVIHDAQYTPEEYVSKKTWGHSTFDYVVQVAAAAGVQRLALTHHDPAHDDAFVANIEERARALALQCGTGLEVFCAYEGCEILLEPRMASKPHVEDTDAKLYVAETDAQPSVTDRQFHILVVDDQPEMLQLIIRALQDHYIVSTAASGQDALKSIAAHIPDLVILDYKMMGMDGVEVLQTLRARPETRALPVLMLTAMTDEPSTRAGFDAGVTDYVTKPFSVPQLTARVRACLTRTQQPPEE